MVELIPDHIPLRVMLNQMAVVAQIKTNREELSLPPKILIDCWAVPLRNSLNWHKKHDCLNHRFGIEPILISTQKNYSNGPDQCGIKCKSSVVIKRTTDCSIFTPPCVLTVSSLLDNKQLLYISKHVFRIYVDVTFNSTFWKFLHKVETISSSGTEFEIKRPALYYKDSTDSLFEVEMSYNTINGLCEIECDSSNSVMIHFDIQRNTFADEIHEEAGFQDVTIAHRLQNEGTHLRTAAVENIETVAVVHGATFGNTKYEDVFNRRRLKGDVKPPRPVSVKNPTEPVEHETVAPVYGATLGNAPLATPTDAGEEQLSMDQYTFYEPSYRSLQMQQQHRDTDVRRQSRAAYGRYVTQEQRQASFASRWPHTAYVQNVDHMVKCGFFYTGNADLIRCHHCGIGLKDWSDVDDPLTEHVRYAPDCQFLIDTVPVAQLARIKASTLQNTIISTRESVSAGGTGRATPSVSGSRPNDEVTLSVQPRSPQYKLKSMRMSSFSKWPRDITQTPEELADAGFFYTDCGDTVRCYVCDGGLQKWSPEDNAWVEHARWFSHCAYVRHMKGDDFIELVRLSVEHQQLEEEGASLGASGNNVRPNEEPIYWKNDFNVPENEDEKAMKPETQTVEELQAETEQLRSVIKCLRCEENDANCLFLQCAHHRLCVQCSSDVTICPICEKKIVNKVKTFMS